ncbi:MAG: double-strand break repair helicase AddA, partial [Parvularculales bacterium]
MTTVPQPTQEQRRASTPETSVWVSANAGSGKTHVLIDRIVRLLLKDALPERILCLTFTRVAASEMKERLFRRLGGWVVMPDDILKSTIETLTGVLPDESALAHARQLFARVLETPGGLKIQTIHGFCEHILKRFPLEAGVPAHFQVLSDHEVHALKQDVRNSVLLSATQDANTTLGRAMGVLGTLVNEQDFSTLFNTLIDQRNIVRTMDEKGATIYGALNLESTITSQSVRQEMAYPQAEKELRAAAYIKPELGLFFESPDRSATLESYLDVFLTKDRMPRKKFPTKKIGNENATTYDALMAEKERLCLLYERYNRALTAEHSLALLTVARAALSAWERAKTKRGFLDYDDLILRTVDLLRTSRQAAWVLYKLDGGLDHILVDEAQDNSTLQWDIVQALTEEFFSGESARETNRTVFAVGDNKQSIFSFQGADPEAFEKMRCFFSSHVPHTGKDFDSVELDRSFRTTSPVLQAVDAIFSIKGCLGTEIDIHHTTQRAEDAGCVELWEPETHDKTPDDDPTLVPHSTGRADHPRTRLAHRIVNIVRGWLDDKTPLPSQGRPITPGDILILVRKRSGNLLVDEMLRLFKTQNIPVAGADRMVMTDQIAVMDLMTLGAFVLLPEDDLTLACVLKSPLFELDEDDLYTIAHNRPGSLWNNLGTMASSNDKFSKVRTELEHLLARTDMVSPFDFYNDVLSVQGGRRKILARLGPDAEDPIDEFLSLALDYESRNGSSLQGFLHWMSNAPTEIKRDMDHGRGEVRIMTVHAAKGLEANIVMLPDCCDTPHGTQESPILEAHSGWHSVLLWGGHNCEPIQQLKNERQKKRNDEYRRLFYVALTRARDQLYIGGFTNKRSNSPPKDSWYAMAQQALEKPEWQTTDNNGATIWRLESKQSTTPSDFQPTRDATTSLPRVPWMDTPAPRETIAQPIAPSVLGSLLKHKNP